MTKSKISIIVPACNAEAYLKRCLDSIQQQTFASYEVIIVDVGSTDDTSKIAQSYVAHDNRFFYYKYDRVLPGIARNYGMIQASSPFIAFADADDALEPDMLASMHAAANRNEADIVVCDFNMVYPDRTISAFSRLSDESFVLSGNNLADYYFRYSAAPKPNNYVWSRLYRASFLEKTGIRFTDATYSEDHMFNLMLSCSMPRISHVGKALYQYIQREDSTVRQNAKKSNHGELYYSVFNSVREFLEVKDGEFVEPIASIYTITRIKSIFFYGQLVNLPESRLHDSLSSFLNGEYVKHYLSLCVTNGYLHKYCQIHHISELQEQLFHELIEVCLTTDQIPLNKGWFS